jgi:hypothetical protein
MPVRAVLCGLLAAAIAILAAPPAPAGRQASPSSAAPSVAARPAAAVSDPPVPGAASGSTAPGTGGGAHPGPASPAAAGIRPAGPSRPDDLPRSLVYSGLFGLAISITGLTLVMSRRRLW